MHIWTLSKGLKSFKACKSICLKWHSIKKTSKIKVYTFIPQKIFQCQQMHLAKNDFHRKHSKLAHVPYKKDPSVKNFKACTCPLPKVTFKRKLSKLAHIYIPKRTTGLTDENKSNSTTAKVMKRRCCDWF